MARSITIKELHATTGAQVRLAASSRVPVVITDRGRPIAVLANPSFLKPTPRKRRLLPEYETLMASKLGHDLSDDLEAVRGER